MARYAARHRQRDKRQCQPVLTVECKFNLAGDQRAAVVGIEKLIEQRGVLLRKHLIGGGCGVLHAARNVVERQAIQARVTVAVAATTGPTARRRRT